jgi:tetratricopeptide (TPR) repeat protein
VPASSSRKVPPLPFDPSVVSDDIIIAQAQIALRGGLVDQALLCAEIVARRTSDIEAKCEALRLRSNAYRLQADWAQAIASAREESELAKAAGLTDRVAEALSAEAGVYLTRADFEAARPLLMRALETTTSPRILGVLWQNLGYLEASLAHFGDADAAFECSRNFFDTAGDLWGSACTLINQGCARIDQGDFESATEILGRAVAAGRAVNDLDLVAGAMMNQARALFRLGRLDDAEFHASSAAGFFVSSRMSLRYAECLLVLGDIELARGAGEVAERCWRRGLETAESLEATGIRDEFLQRLQQDLGHRQGGGMVLS